MKSIATIACLLSATLNTATDAATLFSDDFDTETAQFNTELDNWDILQGSVDVVGNCAGTGRCVDLDGSMGATPPTIIATKSSFTITAGNIYNISFSIPTGTQTDPFTVALGSFFSQDFADYGFPLNPSLGFAATASGSANLSFALTSATNSNFGPYLTSVTLSETIVDGGGPVDPPMAVIPLPASGLLLFGAAGFLMAAYRRRRP